MNRRQIKREAKLRAGLILKTAVKGWSPDNLVNLWGQDDVDKIAAEISALADRLLGGS